GIGMLVSTWKRMWVWHEDVKDLFRFFVKPNESKIGEVKERQTFSGGTEPDPGGNRRYPSYSGSQLIGLILGPLLFILTLLFFRPEGLALEGIPIAASTFSIPTWWITEAVPMPVTPLLPLVLFPVTKGLEMDLTASSYGDETIFLFMGGFMIALAMEKWNLHRRIALTIISLIGTNVNLIVFCFMDDTGFFTIEI